MTAAVALVLLLLILWAVYCLLLWLKHDRWPYGAEGRAIRAHDRRRSQLTARLMALGMDHEDAALQAIKTLREESQLAADAYAAAGGSVHG